MRAGTLNRCANAVEEDLQKRGSRRPETVTTAVVKKNSDEALPLPDLVLGVFTEYATSRIAASSEASNKKRRSGAQADSRFESLRGRLRAIFAIDSGSIYSRKVPFAPW